MKISRLLYTTAVISILFACNNAPSENATEENVEETSEKKEVDLSGMEEIDLSEYDLLATMLVPDESKGNREIGFTEAGNILIKVGSRYGIEIVPFGMTVAEKKEELAGGLVYNIGFIEETENSILYSKTIKDSEIEAETHFFYSAEINGELIEIKSLDGSPFSSGMIKKMLASAKSIKGKSNV